VLRRCRRRPQEQLRGGANQRPQRLWDCPSIAPDRYEDPPFRVHSDRRSSLFSRSPVIRAALARYLNPLRLPVSPPVRGCPARRG
jgi:hypothetical protein